MVRDVSVSPTTAFLTRAVEIGLAAIVFVAPLFMSGRHAIGEFVFVTLCAITFVLWLGRQVSASNHKFLLSGAEWLWAGAIAIVAFQLLPLPDSLLVKLSPQIPQLLPMWAGDSGAQIGLGRWSQISLDPESTRGTLALLIAFAMLFTVATQSIKTLADAQRLLKWVGCSAGAYSLLALAQLFGTEHNTLAALDYAVFTHTSGARGAFPNPNHFGHFAALGIGPLLIWIHVAWDKSSRKSRPGSRSQTAAVKVDLAGRYAAPVLLAACLLGAMLTFSRGAAVGVAVAIVVTGAICLCKRIVDARSLIIAGVCLAISGFAIGTYSYRRISDELATLTAGIDGLDNSHLRRTVWSADLQGGQAFSLLGTGAGTHREVYRTFLDRHLSLEMSHAENGYLQIWLETGSAGIALLTAGILISLFWVGRSLTGQRDRKTAWLCAAASTAGLAASLVHSVYDFIWSVPACVSLALILLAVVCRVGRIGLPSSKRSEVVAPQHAWMAAVVGAACLAVVLIHQSVAPLRAFPHWQAYLDLSMRSNQFDAALTEQKPGAIDPLAVRNMDRMLMHLRRVVEIQPGFARAHARLAGLLERRFEIKQLAADNAMPLSQFRDAAYASQFKSKEEQEAWLTRAMGENRHDLDDALKHARLALRQCPMYGQAYCQLSNLAFLEGHGADTASALIRQARLVRPHSSMVLLTAGIEAAAQGDGDEAQVLLKRVFNQEPRLQLRIIALFGYALGSDQMLQVFEPGYQGLKTLYAFYRDNRNSNGMRTIGVKYAAELERLAATQPRAHSAKNLHYAHLVYREIGNLDEALRCIRQASALSPRDVALRRDLGLRLAESQRYDEAVETLQWCLRRRPSDDSLRAQLVEINRQRLAPRQAADSLVPSPTSPRR